MVPLHDDNPTQNTPVVTYWLVGLNIAIFFFEVSLPSEALQGFFRQWAVVPLELQQNFGQEWITLLTSQFLHGGFLHLGGNMLYLWVFGNNIEDQLGRGKFLFFYLACGVGAALCQVVFSLNSTVPLLGASGAIAGIMGAYIIRFPKAQILTLLPLWVYITTIRVPAVYFLGFWFAQQAFYSVASLQASSSLGGVAYWAHAGGFVCGVGLAPLLGIFDKK